jgi:hypothetical protein
LMEAHKVGMEGEKEEEAEGTVISAEVGTI